MSLAYNLSNTEASFRTFLLAENISLLSIRNYLSDIRHFAGWSNKYNTASPQSTTQTPFDFVSLINQDNVADYKAYLLENRIPLRTINRRLSSLRKLSLFFQKENLLDFDPLKDILNIRFIPEKTPTLPLQSILSEFELSLNDSSDDNLIRNDIRSFLELAS